MISPPRYIFGSPGTTPGATATKIRDAVLETNLHPFSQIRLAVLEETHAKQPYIHTYTHTYRQTDSKLNINIPHYQLPWER